MKTLRVLISDDEQHICSLIKSLIHWDALPLSFLGFAFDGHSCLELIQKHSPDIVITDIRMPGLTGLELIQHCKELNLPTRFIIISGFTQFEYAYGAIKYGVEDFLLKPIGETELNDSLQRLCSGAVVKNQPPPMQTLSQAFLGALLNGSLSSCELSAASVRQHFHLTFPEGHFLFARLHLDKCDAAEAYTYRLLSSFLQKLFTTPLAKNFGQFIDFSTTNQLLLLLHYQPAQLSAVKNHLQNYLESVCEIIRPYEFMTLSLCVVTDIENLSALPAALAVSSRLCESRYCLGTGQILYNDMLIQPLQNLPPLPDGSKMRILESLKTMDPAQNSAVMRALLCDSVPDCTQNPYWFYDHAHRLSMLWLESLDTVIDLNAKRSAYEKRLQSIFSSFGDQKMLVRRLLHLYEEVVTQWLEVFQSAENKVIQSVKAYVQTHYHEKLELEDVAKQVYLNPSYLGTFFKRETGINFSEYLISVRIEQAKSMLKEITYTISEIADRVGYRDANHFSKVFQKQVGIKPSEYRKLRRP